jgi:exosortase A-associated hydrolase 2
LKIFQEAFFLPVDGGQCFAVHRAPGEGGVRAAVLHLPAFGDEMNKARAMTARAARAFAAAGCAVLQVDWLGCGDSFGDHADATLLQWTANAHAALAWLRQRHPRCPVTGLWALRAGALLVPALAGSLPDAFVMLWQPVLSGTQQLNQLLRIQSAGAVANAADASSAKALRARLRAGETLEIGGYALSPALAAELEAAAFELPAQHRGPVAWFEVSPSAQALSEPATKRVEQLRAAGIRVQARAVAGPSFWQSVEIERCDLLVAQSCAVLPEMLGELSGAAAVL